MQGMTDAEALNFLVEKLGSKTALAESLQVSVQRLHNWYDTERGISFAMRGRVWAMVNDHGGNLSRDWLLEKAA